ncbi:MAG: hypothetical protein OHK0013_09840 [Sandaracinaceae bacterium]
MSDHPARGATAGLATAWLLGLSIGGATALGTLPTLSGMGNRGARADDLTGVGGNVLVVVITREEVAHRMVGLLEEMWGDAIGVLFVSDVEVMRADKF